MKRVVLDTSAYCYAMRGEESVIHVLRHAASVLVPAIVVGELSAGFRGGGREKQNKAQLAAFLQKDRVSVLNVTAETADFYALVINLLKTKGKPIPTNDVWIASIVLEHGARLLTMDAHYRHIDGLYILPE